MKHVIIYTDGACSGNPGPGGWAAILIYGRHERELFGGERQTTNNRMELTAAIKALQALSEQCEVTLHSDSKYLIDAVTKGWAKSWRNNNWIKSDKKPAQNSDLWEKILGLCEMHKVEFVWVRGHSGDEYNERCDALATAQSRLYL